MLSRLHPPPADRKKRKLFESAPGYVQREKDRAAQKREEAAARRRAKSEERSEERAALENSAGIGVGSTSESEVRQERAEGEEKDGGCSPGPDVGVISAVSAVDGGGDSEANGGVRSPLEPSSVASTDVAVGQGLNHAVRASCDGSGDSGGGHGCDARTAAVVDGHHGAHLALVTPPSTASSVADSSSPDTNLTALPSPSPPETPLASLEPICSAHSVCGGGGGGGGVGGGGGGGAGGGGGGSNRQSLGSETDMEDRAITGADGSAVAHGGDDATAARLPSTALRDQRGTDLTMGGVSGGSLVRGGGVPVHSSGSGSGGCSRRKEGEAPPEGTGVTVLGGACEVADIGSGGGDVDGVRLDGDGVDPDGETGIGAGEGLRDSHGERAEEEAERADDDYLVGGGLSAMDVMLTQEQEEAEACTLMYGE